MSVEGHFRKSGLCTERYFLLWWRTSVAGRQTANIIVLAVGSVRIGNDCATLRNDAIELSRVNRRFAAILTAAPTEGARIWLPRKPKRFGRQRTIFCEL
jgi:hypothetical protein